MLRIIHNRTGEVIGAWKIHFWLPFAFIRNAQLKKIGVRCIWILKSRLPSSEKRFRIKIRSTQNEVFFDMEVEQGQIIPMMVDFDIEFV